MRRQPRCLPPDVDWEVMGLRVGSHEDMLEALQKFLGSDTIRHVLTNTVVTVIDEDHATARSYNTLYYTAGARIEDQDGPLEFEGPHRTHDAYVELVRTADGWRNRQTALGNDFPAQSGRAGHAGDLVQRIR